MHVAVFGKIPSRGDFLKQGIQGPALVALERWFFESAQDLFGAGGHFPNEPFKLVVGQPGWSEAVAAVAVPSRDSVGRSFPLVACACLDARTVGPRTWLVPLVTDHFLQQAPALLTQAAAQGDENQLISSLGGLASGGQMDLATGEATFVRVVSNEGTADFETRLFQPRDVRFYAYQTLARACHTVRGGGPDAGLVVGCPVTQAEDVLIWNALAGALTGAAVPMMWQETAVPRLVLLIGGLLEASLRCLVDENCSARSYWPLTTTHTGAMTAAQQALAKVGFGDVSGETVQGLLDRIGTLAGKSRRR
jgi:type VI secretion system ImpM family protein